MENPYFVNSLMYGAMSRNYLMAKIAQRCKIEAVNDKYEK